MLAGDVDELDRLLDDALLFVGPDTRVYGKADDLALHRTRTTRFTCLDARDLRLAGRRRQRVCGDARRRAPLTLPPAIPYTGDGAGAPALVAVRAAPGSALAWPGGITMKTRLVPALAALSLALAAAATVAQGGERSAYSIGELNEYSIAATAAPAGVTPVLYNLPDGTGALFTQACRPTGATVDATITLTVYDAGMSPVANVPATEMWLEKEIVSGTGNFVACLGGTMADGPTNALGVTHWVQPLHAGGWSTAKTLVVINGAPLVTNTGLVLSHNSADLNGDGAVNLADVPLFAADFYGSYRFRSDLRYDHAVNLSDIPRLAGALGVGCP